jgi:hypothetical protein
MLAFDRRLRREEVEVLQDFVSAYGEQRDLHHARTLKLGSSVRPLGPET